MNFNIEGLKRLISEAGLSYTSAAERMGIPVDSFHAIMQGDYKPSIDTMIKMADYFAVPLDFLAGRCSLEQANNILNDYGKYFRELRTASYEQYLDTRPKMTYPSLKEDTELPFPYNLYEAILDKPVNWVITQEQKNGLEWAMNSLTDKEKDIIYLYYHDGYTLSRIGEKYSVTRERIRQIITKGIRKLRHPSRKEAILGIANKCYSMDEVEKEAEKLSQMTENYHKNADALAKAENLVFVREQKVNEIISILKNSNLEEVADVIKKIEEVQDKKILDIVDKRKLDRSIEALDLSVRSYNTLLRAGVFTIADIVNMIDYEPEQFEKIRNLGVKCRMEIVEKLDEYLGGYKYKEWLRNKKSVCYTREFIGNDLMMM